MATEKKETAQRDAQGVRKQSYKRFKEGRDYEPTDAETTAALCDAFLTGFLQTEETPEGGEVQNNNYCVSYWHMTRQSALNLWKNCIITWDGLLKSCMRIRHLPK